MPVPQVLPEMLMSHAMHPPAKASSHLVRLLGSHHQVAVAVLIPNDLLEDVVLPEALPRWGIWGTAVVGLDILMRAYARRAFASSGSMWANDGEHGRLRVFVCWEGEGHAGCSWACVQVRTSVGD